MFLNKKQQVKEGYVGRGNCKGTWETLTQNPSTFEEPMLRELSQEKHLAGDTRSLAKNSASSINCFRDETPSSLITCVHNSITTYIARRKELRNLYFLSAKENRFHGKYASLPSFIIPPSTKLHWTENVCLKFF